MTVRWLLTLLLILSAPLSAGQHAGCASPAEQVTAEAESAHRHDHHASHHHGTPDSDAGQVAEADCSTCDATCQAACANVAATPSLLLLTLSGSGSEPGLSVRAIPLMSHPLPLLRPPAHSAT
jgi:hypothetical protein